MSSKSEILSAIRRQTLPPRELPSLEQDWITYADPERQYREVLEGIGGRVVVAEDVAAIQRDLDQHEPYTSARQIVSLIPGIARANLDLNQIADAHELETVNFAILPGEFAVAENGAVWITDAGVKHRAIYFIPQHLALVIPRREILSNMHQAYERLNFDSPRFGCFISGPSKTADIEQSLVIGAHGPKSTTVYLLN